MSDSLARIKRYAKKILKRDQVQNQEPPIQILLLTNRDSDNIGDQVIEASDIGLISAVMKNLDITNYKIVRINDFAYNPARINVGSIARLKRYESGIVSPMYICFHSQNALLPEYLELFFYTQYFKHEMYKRLEGSVRLCLSFEGLTNIPIFIPEITTQREISIKVNSIETKIGIEETYLNALKVQKQYLLKHMFI